MPEGKIVTEVNKLYRDVSTEGGQVMARWWLSRPENVHEHVVPIARQIETNLAPRRNEWVTFGRLYAGREFRGFGPGGFARRSTPNASGRLALNVVRSCIATASAKLSSKKPRCFFLGCGAGYETKEKARLLTKFVDGVFSGAGAYAVARRAFVDAATYGLGSVKVFVRDGKIAMERVAIDENLIDEEDGRDGNPRQRHQRKYVSREELFEQFGKDKKSAAAIRDAKPVNVTTGKSVAERIAVYESWHLPSGPGADDGRHVIALEGAALFAESWDHPWFPVVDFTWEDDLAGPYGVGLAEQLVGIQIEINRVLRQISKAIELSIPRAFLHANSKVSPGSLTDEIWSIVRYAGQPPTFTVPAAVSPETFRHLADLYAKSYEITGISQMAAQARKEPGIDSGVALREMSDIASERFLVTGQRWEEFFMRIARVAIELARDLAENDPTFSVKIKDGKSGRDMRWLDIDLDEDQYILEAYPVGFLPSTPAGKLQYIQDLMKSGLVTDRERLLQMLDHPDTEEWLGVETAGLRYVQRAISRILDRGQWVEPTKFMPLDLAITLSQMAILEGEDDDRPRDRLDMLVQWSEACVQLQTSLQPAPPAPLPQQAMPPGAPAPQPIPAAA